MQEYPGVDLRLLHLMDHCSYRVGIQFINKEGVIVVHKRFDRFVNDIA